MKIIIKKVFIIFLVFIMFFCSTNTTFIAYSINSQLETTSDITYKEVVNNREPRLQFKRTDKNYLYIYLHDDSGIQTDKSYFMFNNKKYKVEKLEHINGAYTEGGKRYELFKKGQYTGKRFDYGIKIKNSDLTTNYQTIFVFSYDYWGGCFIKETFKIKKYEKISKEGFYYTINNAPRVTLVLKNGKPQIDAIDYSGIKSIKIVAEKTKETVYSYSVLNNIENIDVSESSSKPNSEKSGYILKDNLYYPIRVIEDINMNTFKKSGIGNNRYKIRVIAEDISGIKNEKTMITRISPQKSESPTTGGPSEKTSELDNEIITVNGKKITKAQYANFRNVCAGKIAPNVLYRCINPILPYSSAQKKPAYYADQLLENHNVNTILSLSDSLSSMKKNGYSKSTYYKKLLKSGKVHVHKINDDGWFGSKSDKKAIASALKVIVNNKGPYAIHCKWGQGRTGITVMLLECLMGASYDYMYNDFITSFKNFNLVKSHKTSASSYNKEFSNYMESITGKKPSNKKNPKASDWKNVDFVKAAEKYLKSGGMTDSEIQKLKNHLSGQY